METRDEQQRTFEENFERLKEIVEELSAGELPLEEMQQRFEEGVRLAAWCNEKLNVVEACVQKVVKNELGEVELENLEEEDETDAE